jgi:polyferredoxin
MDRLNRPRGLIRYSSRDELAGAPRRIVRPRIVLYPVLLLAVWGALGFALAHRAPADVTVLRGLGSPFTVLPSGRVSNQIRVKIVNRGSTDHRYRIALADGGGAAGALEMIAPDNPVAVAAGKSATTTLFITAPAGAFDGGVREVELSIGDDAGWSEVVRYRLLGPGDRGGDRHGR